jgi:hypothetical protein
MSRKIAVVFSTCSLFSTAVFAPAIFLLCRIRNSLADLKIAKPELPDQNLQVLLIEKPAGCLLPLGDSACRTNQYGTFCKDLFSSKYASWARGHPYFPMVTRAPNKLFVSNGIGEPREKS